MPREGRDLSCLGGERLWHRTGVGVLRALGSNLCTTGLGIRTSPWARYTAFLLLWALHSTRPDRLGPIHHT